MKSCPFCGRAIDDDAKYCSGCGKEIDEHDEITHNPITEAMLHYDEMPVVITKRKNGIVRCPRCGEHNLHPINETTTSVQTSGGGYSSSKGCLGWLLFGPVGLLCGGLGQKQRTSVNTSNKLYWICNECGFKFRNLDDWNNEIETKMKQQKINQYSAITLAVLALLFLMIGGGMELLGILFLAIGATNGILAFTLNQISNVKKKTMKDFKKNQWSDDLYGRLMKIGCSTGCHQDPQRSFQINGYQFPICARCTGIPIGYLIGFLVIFWIRIPVLISIGMILSMFYDWYIQYLGIRESTNIRRCITGILYGIGVINIIFWIVTKFLKIP